MAYSLIANTFSIGASGGSTTPSINTTGADLIVVGVVQSGVHTGVLSDSKSNTWTAIGTLQNSAQEAVQLFYCSPPTVGSGHTFTTTGTSSFSSAFVQAFSGSASSPLDQQTGNNSGAAALSIATGSITPSQDNEVICVMYGNEGTAGAQAMDSGVTITDIQGISGPTWGSSMGYKVQTAAAAINVTGSTATNATNAIAIASFKAPAPNINVNLVAVDAAGSPASLGAGPAPGLVKVSGAGSAAALALKVDVPLSIVSGAGSAATFGIASNTSTLPLVSGSGVAASLSLTITSNITLTAVSSAGSAQTFATLSPSLTLPSVSASGVAASLAQNTNVALDGVFANGEVAALFVASRIVSLSAVGAIADKLAIDAITSDRPVASNGTMSDNPVVSIGTLLAA